MKRIVFLTGTRADFGKMKSLMRACEMDESIDLYVYVSGMHLIPKYGSTYREVLTENFKNVYLQRNRCDTLEMDKNIAALIGDFSEYVKKICPDMIVVHGDRIDALAGATVAMLNSILLAHIEGGEVTGTVDEAIRHAISKMANLHFVSNDESKYRLMQMGEKESKIFVIGSPDIDIMLSDSLPELKEIKCTYHIPFDKYAILIYHPVVSEVQNLEKDIDTIMRSLKSSGSCFLVIYPNNDTGTNFIISCYEKYKTEHRFMFFPSINFECFLTLLKNSEYIIGNSSCGVREACVYGVPAIDIGTRQKNRYSVSVLSNIQHVSANQSEIEKAILDIDDYRVKSTYFGYGNSTEQFLRIINDDKIWCDSTQKQFYDTLETKKAISAYHSEVCF